MWYYCGSEFVMIFQEFMFFLNLVFCCGEQVVEGMCYYLKFFKSEVKVCVLALFEEVQLFDFVWIYQAYFY